MKQTTFAQESRVSGIALHSGRASVVTISPATEYTGVRFRVDGRTVKSEPDATEIENTTCIGDRNHFVATVEHFMSAISAVGISNCEVRVEGCNELPILDGSALEWIGIFRNMGVRTQDANALFMRVEDTGMFRFRDSTYRYWPEENLRIECHIDFSHCVIGRQELAYTHSAANYLGSIAWARTFLREPFQDSTEFKEKLKLRLKGLDLLLEPHTPVILYNDKYLSVRRGENEEVRHKILDFVGDIRTLIPSMKGRFLLDRPSHQGNIEFGKHLLERYELRTKDNGRLAMSLL